MNRERRTIRLSFILSNSGTAPAEDIDVFFHFPDGFELYDERELPPVPNEPQPPEKPIGGFVSLISPYTSGLTLETLEALRLQNVRPRNVSGPQIRRTNSYDVNFHVKQLKHNLIEGLGPLYLVFDSYDEAGSLGIDYRMLAANLPKPASGRLHVIIRKGIAHQ